MTTPGGKVKTPVGDAPVVPMFLLGAGMYLAWFGVHYWRADTKYPTDPVKAVLQGKGLPSATQTPTADEAAVAAASKQLQQAGIGAGVSTDSNPNAFGQAVAQGTGSGTSNQHIGQLLAAQYGWSSGANWDALVKLWTQESNWNNRANNQSSGAYGIPQALPYTKMPKAAWPESAGGSSDPTSQINWGLGYIKSRYGSPSAAWAHEQANNWY